MSATYTGVTLILDPKGFWQHINNTYIEDSLGLIPTFIRKAILTTNTPEELLKKVWEIYQFGYYRTASETTAQFNDGVVTYPDSNETYLPIAKYVIENVSGKQINFWQYPYALLAFEVDGELLAIGIMD